MAAPVGMGVPGDVLRLSNEVASWSARYATCAKRPTTRSVEGFLAIAIWARDQVPFPGGVFRHTVDRLIRQNGLLEGVIRTGGARCASRTSAARSERHAEQDTITLAASSEPLTRLVGSDDVSELRLESGHIGFVAGRHFGSTMDPRRRIVGRSRGAPRVCALLSGRVKGPYGLRVACRSQGHEQLAAGVVAIRVQRGWRGRPRVEPTAVSYPASGDAPERTGAGEAAPVTEPARANRNDCADAKRPPHRRAARFPIRGPLSPSTRSSPAPSS